MCEAREDGPMGQQFEQVKRTVVQKFHEHGDEPLFRPDDFPVEPWQAYDLHEAIWETTLELKEVERANILSGLYREEFRFHPDQSVFVMSLNFVVEKRPKYMQLIQAQELINNLIGDALYQALHDDQEIQEKEEERRLVADQRNQEL